MNPAEKTGQYAASVARTISSPPSNTGLGNARIFLKRLIRFPAEWISFSESGLPGCIALIL
jgi:hypothetical protein